MAMWRVQVLGGLALSRGDQTITRFESGRVAILLAYLALHPRRAHAREELLEMLWPDVDPEQSRARLRQALYSLRHQLEPPGTPANSVLLADRQNIRLNPEAFTCDATEFERLARQGQAREARALYAGDLLPGYYDDWALQERDRLALMYENLPSEPPALAPAPSQAARLSAARSAPEAAHKPEDASRVVHLPGYMTLFLGRGEEQEQLRELLASHRLVTITGLGGVGKTRLAVAAARAFAPGCDTVVFVPLADCASPAQIPEMIRTALHLPPSSSSTLDQIAAVLSGRRTLLLLDNFEQLVAEEGAVLVESLLMRLPDLTCLVTSRRLLSLDGEQEFPLVPFPALPPEAPLDEAARNPGVALFVQRAQTARPGFQLTESNRGDIVALCSALENIPLALELAASRIRALTPAEMRGQIQARFTWLTRAGIGADKEPRQRSLTGALEWSWRLLSPSQQRFLAALSVFRGGWTADMAALVCAASDARERLESLVMDSLVVSASTAAGTTRFHMLETVREFARLRLEIQAGKSDALRQGHRQAFLDLAARNKGRSAALLPESENLLAALNYAVEDGDAECALTLCSTVDDGWLVFAGPQTALPLLRRALGLPGGSARARIKALHVASYLALVTETPERAWELAAQAGALAGEGPAERALALCVQCSLAISLYAPLEPIRLQIEEAIALANQTGERRCEALLYKMQGICAQRRGEIKEAERCLARALQMFEDLDDPGNAVYTLDCLANAALKHDDTQQALAIYEQCRTRAQALGDKIYEAKVWHNFATIYGRQARWNEALTTGQEALRRNHAIANGYILAFTLWNLPEPLAHLGFHAQAAQIMGYSERSWSGQFGPLDDEDKDFCANIRALAAATLGDAQTDTLWSEGARLTQSQAIQLALSV